MDESAPDESSSSQPSLTGWLLIGLNIAVLVVMGVFVFWDYHAGWETLLRQKRVAMTEEGEQFGRQRVQELLEESGGKPPDRIAQTFGITLEQHQQRRRQADDITLMIVRAGEASKGSED